MEKRLVNRLDKDEILAELAARGWAEAENKKVGIDELRKKLRKCLRFEDDGAIFSPKKERSAEEELDICKGKLAGVTAHAAKCSDTELKAYSKKAEAKLHHILLRVSRIDTTQHPELADQIMDLMAQGDTQLAAVKQPTDIAAALQTPDTKNVQGGGDSTSRRSSRSSTTTHQSDRTCLSSSSSSERRAPATQTRVSLRRRITTGKPSTTRPRPLISSDSEEDAYGLSDRRPQMPRFPMGT